MSKTKNKGLSVIIRNEEQFNKIKSLLGEDILYLDYLPQMAIHETGIVLFAKKKTELSSGTVGSTSFHKDQGLKIVEFSDYFKE